MADWVSIKAEYVSGCGSYRALSEKHGVSLDAIKRKAAADGWAEERAKTAPKIHQETVRLVVRGAAKQNANRITRLLTIGDSLAERLEQAATELDQKLVTQKRKTKTVEYGQEAAKGKPVKEVITEEETLAVVTAPIDRLGIQQLSATLKNLHDIAKVSDQSGDSDALQKARELLGGVHSAID